jgi:hypothetical protein
VYELRPFAASAATNASTRSSLAKRPTPPLTTLPRSPQHDRRSRLGRSTRQDVSQTEPLPDREPVALEPPREPIGGDSRAGLFTPLENLAAELGYTVRHLPLDGGADGWCDSERMEIAVNERLPANAQVRVLVHELAHALGVGYEQYGRQQAEVLVDCVTYIVCGSAGLDVSGDSVPYVAGWGEDGALDAIRTYAETIDTIARRIETAIRDDDDSANAADGADHAPLAA